MILFQSLTLGVSLKSTESESFILEQHSRATAGLPLGALFPISEMSNSFKGTGAQFDPARQQYGVGTAAASAIPAGLWTPVLLPSSYMGSWAQRPSSPEIGSALGCPFRPFKGGAVHTFRLAPVPLDAQLLAALAGITGPARSPAAHITCQPGIVYMPLPSQGWPHSASEINTNNSSHCAVLDAAHLTAHLSPRVSSYAAALLLRRGS